jgi:hypothetical protein
MNNQDTFYGEDDIYMPDSEDENEDKNSRYGIKYNYDNNKYMEEQKKEENTCEICGAKLTEDKVCRDLYHELSYYTLTHPKKEFFATKI